MSRNLVNNATYHKKAYMGIGFIAIAIVIIGLVLSALFILPNMAIYKEPAEQRTIVSLVPENNGLIGVGADTKLVYVTVEYSDGTTESVPLSEFIHSGLDVSTEHEELNVVLNYGGFEQEVNYSVLSTMKTLKYVASTGGRIEGDSTQYIFSGGDASTVIAIADEGYEFVRWSDGNPNAMRTDTKLASDKELTATFQKQKFTVVFFYPDGTTAREEIVSYGEAATTDPNPDMDADMQKYGYVFTGWSQSFDSITANTNVYPLFEKYATDVTLQYTQDIEGNNLGEAIDLMSYYPKDKVAILKVKANYGKVFAGWSILTKDGTYVNLSATGANATLEIEDLLNYVVFTTSGSDTTEEYSLTFTPTPETDELTVIANFEYEESAISFYSMGSRVHQDVTVKRGEAIGDVLADSNLSLEANHPSYDSLVADIAGYTFIGWYDDNAELDSEGNVVILTDAQTFIAPTNLVAYWEKNTYIATFTFANTDQAGITDDVLVEVYYQDPISNAISNAFPTTVPTKVNYTFVGWYLLENGAVTDVVINRNYKVNGDIQIGAKFEVNKQSVTADITGSGAVYVKETQASNWNSLTGSYEMAVTGSYEMKFEASTGYTIDSITYTTSTNKNEISVNGVKGSAEHTLSIDPSVSYEYKVTYRQAVNRVTINNGDSISQGSIEYISGEASDVVTDAIINIDVEYNASISLWINAPYGYHISKVVVGTDIKNIPTNATKFTVPIENVTTAQSVKIEYAKQNYTVEIPQDDDSLLEGTITQVQGSAENSYGSDVKYEVVAKEGYYIKSLIVNGYNVDPYATHSGVSIEDMEINYQQPLDGVQNASGNAKKDYRITSYLFTILGITENTLVEIIYGEIFYTITASVVGSGWTNVEQATVLRGNDITVTASCYDGNYISSYEVNGVLTNKESADSSTAITLSDVKEDTAVVFTTEAVKYNISYQNNDNGALLTYDNGESLIEAGENKNFPATSNTTFVIEANYGKYITSIFLDGVAITDLAYNAKSYTLAINGLDKGHTIVVTTANIAYDITVYLGNAGTSTMTVAGEPSNEAKVSHGSPLVIEIQLENGKSVDENTITYSINGSFETQVDTMDLTQTITITPIYADMVVFIPLADFVSDDSAKTIFDVSFSGEQNGTLAFESNDSTSSASDMTVNKNGNFTVKAVADSGYELKYLVVNGVSVNCTKEGDGKYSYTVNNVTSDINVDAVFDVITYKLDLSTQGNGTATTSSLTYNYKQPISLRINSVAGYTLAYISISTNGEPAYKFTDVSTLFDRQTGEYVIGSEYSEFALAIEVGFVADTYNMTVTANEGGRVDNVKETISYGESVSLDLKAESGYFIDAIKVNGINIDPSTLGGNPILDTSIQEYTAGTLIFTATQETQVEITFKANVYLVTVVDALDGSVGVRKSIASSSTGNVSTAITSSLYLNNNDDMDIVIDSQEGYHVTEILINGVAIDGWQIDGSAGAENVNSSLIYTYKSVKQNLSVKVSFAINEYDISLTTVNDSVNFSDFDTASSSYGMLGIYGYAVDGGFTYDPTADVSNGVVCDVEHGSSIIFILNPVNSKGYYVSSFTIQYIDPNDVSGNTITEDFTVSAQEYGQVIFSMEHEIVNVKAVFSKYTYTLEEKYIANSAGSTYYASDSSISVAFSNPYDTTIAVKTVNGTEYEYGITYVVTSIAGVGYTRTSLLVNDAERNASVRGDMYSSSITDDLVIEAYYDINVYTIGVSANIYAGTFAMGDFEIQSDSNECVWASNSASGSSITSGTFSSNSGIIYVNNGVLSVTHGTMLYFIATPNNAQGYMLTSIRINNATQAISNEDEQSSISMYIESATSYSASMALHTYDIDYELSVVPNGAKVTLSNTVVDWGKNAVVSASVYAGYYIAGVSINGLSSAEALNALKTQGQYTMLSIKEDTTITIIMACNNVDIQFSGMYNTNVATNVAEGEDNRVSVTVQSKTSNEVYEHSTDDSTGFQIPSNGIIAGANDGGAKYSDKITLQFSPVVGYQMDSISIYMYNQNGNLQSSVVAVDTLNYNASTNSYSYVIDPLVGKVMVNVTYVVRTYSISINAIGSGSIGLGTEASEVTHYELIEMFMNAYYGYHLSSLKINDIAIQTNSYTFEENELGSKVYSYTAEDYVLNDILNNTDSIYIEAVFVINEYDVLFYVNGSASSDFTLTPSIVDNSIQYSPSRSSYVNQVTSEGYSVTSIIFYNGLSTTVGVSSVESYNIDKYWNTDLLSFKVSGEVMDMLDIHAVGQLDTLYIYYVTTLDTHISTVQTYLSEEGADANPTDDKFNLSSSYTTSPIDGKYEYFTTATLSLTLTTAQSEDYYFAGFQEYNAVTDTWSYVVSGQDGITLNSSGTILTYMVKADREFRAVVFRQYDVIVEVHPEFKYISGTNANNTVDMVYRQYASLTAKATYNGLQPNIEGNVISVADSDGDATNGVYVYKVLNGATLSFTYLDSVTGTNKTSSISYYDKDLSVDRATSLNYTAGVTILKDTDLHAYFNNTVKVTFFAETEGSDTNSDSASITYTLNGKTTTPSSGVITTTANSRIKVTIVPKPNYAFVSLATLEESINSPDSNGNKVWTGNWIDVISTADGYTTVEYTYDNGEITKVVMDMVVTENMVYNMSFIKMIYVNSSVNMLSDDYNTESGILAMPTLASDTNGGLAVTDTYVEYNTKLNYTILIPEESYSQSNTLAVKYQFMGFSANGVLNHTNIGATYPNMTLVSIGGKSYYSYSVTYTIADYSASTQKDGVIIAENNNQFEVDICANISPIYNIVIENEYEYDFNDDEMENIFFDTGLLTASSAKGYFDMGKMNYNPSTKYIESSTKDVDNSILLQMLDQQNNGRSYSTDALSDYNSWSDTQITLNWASSTIPSMQSMYSFIAWQYYGINENGVVGWHNIPYTYNNGQIDATSSTYTFPISALYEYTYLSQGRNDDCIYTSGDLTIDVIKIRPAFQRQIEVNIDRVVYYEADGVSSDKHKNDNPASLSSSGETSGIFKYYDDVITMTPETQSGYEFLGWYYRDIASGEYILIDADSSTNNMYLEGNNLILYVTEDIYDAMTNTITVYPRYIKTWKITFQVANLSGTSSLMNLSVPTIMSGDVGVNDGDYFVDVTTIRDVGLTLYTVIIRAGTQVGFTLKATENFDENNDSYAYTTTTVEGVTYIWNGSSLIDLPSLEASDFDLVNSDQPETISSDEIDSSYIIYGNADKKITVNYETTATLTVNNFYYGSTLVLNKDLAGVMGVDAIKDGSEYDADGTENGVIVITKIPVIKGVSYNGGYGCQLPGIAGIIPIVTTNFGINFDGNSITSKSQSFNYFNTDGLNNSATALNVPFANGLNGGAGDGTQANPYQIATQAQLVMVNSVYLANGNTLDGIYFKLIGDITLGNYIGNLCSVGNGFDGVFDGNNRTITNIYLSSGESATGLFAKIFKGTVHNLTLAKITLSRSGSNNVGGLAGIATDATLYNITISDSALVNVYGASYVGGVVGYVSGDATAISNIIVKKVNAQGVSYIGGAFGAVEIENAQVENAINVVTITSPTIRTTTERGGGAIGAVLGATIKGLTITVNAPTVTGNGKYLGGVIGYNAGTMTNLLVTGNAKIESRINSAFQTSYMSYEYSYGGGGIVGYNAPLGKLYNPSLGTSDGASGRITMNGSASGGIIGMNAGYVSGSDTNSYEIYVLRSTTATASEGGAYSAHVAYNLGSGTIVGAKTSKSLGNFSATDFNYSVLTVRTSAYSFSTLESGSPNASPKDSDKSCLYVGIVAGVNFGGRVTNSVVTSGKIVVHRSTGVSYGNSTYVGGLVGVNTNASNVTDSDGVFASGIRVCVFYSFWADTASSPATANVYMGTVTGNNVKPAGTCSVSNSQVFLNTVAYGASRTIGRIHWDWFKPRSSDSGFKTASIKYQNNIIAGAYGASIINASTRQPATGAMYTDKDGSYYSYSKSYRYLAMGTL